MHVPAGGHIHHRSKSGDYRGKVIESAAAALTALAAVTVVAPAPASAAAVTIKVERAYAETVREWIDPFTCPTNTVLTGRSHYGDEDAPTTYYCSFVHAVVHAAPETAL
ncbi:MULTISPECIES: hypothetical protein [Nonomuraea]|uniref:hypothetical protein n=1 Tax=Nonomuraea TaxID=83681 RepID=UPI0036D4325B